MTEISLHILDLVQNSVEAGASRVVVRVSEDACRDLLEVAVEDNGRGMTPEVVSAACDPFFTTRTSRDVGMGLALAKQNAEATGGSLEVVSGPGEGTTVTVRFVRSHVDRSPLGSISSTLAAIGAVNPWLELVYRHEVRAPGRETAVFRFSTSMLTDGTDPDHGSGPFGGFDPRGFDNPSCVVAFGEWVKSGVQAVGSEGS